MFADLAIIIMANFKKIKFPRQLPILQRCLGAITFILILLYRTQVKFAAVNSRNQPTAQGACTHQYAYVV
jgi:nicotinamide riboside kinase